MQTAEKCKFFQNKQNEDKPSSASTEIKSKVLANGRESEREGESTYIDGCGCGHGSEWWERHEDEFGNG